MYNHLIFLNFVNTNSRGVPWMQNVKKQDMWGSKTLFFGKRTNLTVTKIGQKEMSWTWIATADLCSPRDFKITRKESRSNISSSI